MHACSAIQHYTSAIDADSTVPLFYAKRAAAYQSIKKLGQALRDLDAALEADGSYSTGYLHRGKLHRCVVCLPVRQGCWSTQGVP